MLDVNPNRKQQTAQNASQPRRQPSPANPRAMVIFGAGGDLTQRLVVPALYNLSHTKVLPEKFALIETLLYDVMIGDPTLFMRADMVEQAWRIVQPVLDAWAKEGAADLPIYQAGGSGPSEADALLARDGRSWRSIGDDDLKSS